MVSPAGVPVAIMVYGEEGNAGVLVTCLGSGSPDRPPIVEGEATQMAILGVFNLDVVNTDPSSRGKVEHLLKESFGEKVVRTAMLLVELTANNMGFPLA